MSRRTSVLSLGRSHNQRSFNLMRPLLPNYQGQLNIHNDYRGAMPPDINPEILNIINDKSFLNSAPTVEERVITVYKKLGFVVRPDNFKLIAWYFLLVIIFIYFFL